MAMNKRHSVKKMTASRYPVLCFLLFLGLANSCYPERRSVYRYPVAQLDERTSLATETAAQEKHSERSGFKVFISEDMEGITGVVFDKQTGHEGRDYPIFRTQTIDEVNEAIRAAFEAGATEVDVVDSHGGGVNLEPDKLDRRAVLITGAPKPAGMMQGLDDSFAAVLFIGYHARGSTPNGVLAHTYSLAPKVVRLNGREVGEYGLNAALAGYFGVPVVFICGDAATAEQARTFIPGVETLVVKQAFGRTAARTLSFEDAREQIAAGVKSSLARRQQIHPVQLARPITLEIELAETTQADATMLVPGMQRVSDRVVRYVAPDMSVAYRISVLVERLAGE
jgi:D-amino peptidase